MNRSYQIVNEAIAIREPPSKKAVVASVVAGFGAWYLNRFIRTRKVLKAYPNPSDLKQRLISSSNPNVSAIGKSMNSDMDYEQYKAYVARITNPKMGAGKAVLMVLFGATGFTPVYQLGKAAIHGAESGDTILQRGIDKGRIYYT